MTQIAQDPRIDAIDWYLDPLPGQAFAAALHRLRRQGPVVRVTAMGGAMPAHYIVGYAALAEAFKDGDCFPPGLAYQHISEPFIGRTFMSMDEPGNKLWRPAITPAFRRQAVERLDEARFAGLAHELIDRFSGETEADLCTRFTRLFAFAVICDRLGLPRDREAEFFELSMDLMFGGLDLEKSRAADAVFTAYATPVLAARRTEPQNDVLTHLCTVEVEGRPLTDDEVLAHLRLFFTAGATTTSDALGNLVHALLTHREAWDACVDDPANCEHAVEELLRFDPPVAAQPRFSNATRDVEFAGVRIPAHSPVLFGIAAANRDPDVFPDPDRFDIERRPTGLLTFGPGLRTCPGMHLARKNLRIALEVLTTRLPGLRLVDAEKSEPRGILLRGPEDLRARLG